ncbi:hypothetical protein BJY01DRAFT_250304 [Aspergillus pseudoustus]|uniref:Uncharacterized protein n=1 Tax=Aspergillus pseudoustus TaxID=1810923 RepID=A0ABR4JJ78_9EURO
MRKFFFKANWYPQLDSSLRVFTQDFHRLIVHYEESQLNPSIISPTDHDLFLIFEHQLRLGHWAAARMVLGWFFYTDQDGWEAEKVAEEEFWRDVVPQAYRGVDTPVIFL